jgi:hypothetical protein
MEYGSHVVPLLSLPSLSLSLLGGGLSYRRLFRKALCVVYIMELMTEWMMMMMMKCSWSC